MWTHVERRTERFSLCSRVCRSSIGFQWRAKGSRSAILRILLACKPKRGATIETKARDSVASREALDPRAVAGPHEPGRARPVLD